MTEASRPTASRPARRREDFKPVDQRRAVVPASIWGLGLAAIVISELIAVVPAAQLSAAPEDATSVFVHGA